MTAAKKRINPVRRSGIQLELLVLFCSLLYLVSYIPNMTELVNRVLPQVHMSNINGIYVMHFQDNQAPTTLC